MDDKQAPQESMGNGEKKKSYNVKDESAAAHKEEDVSPLGEGIIPAFYVVFNTKLQQFGLIGAQGFLDDRVRAYGALYMAQKQLDSYYAAKDKANASMITRIKNFDAKGSFNRFIRGK